MSLAWITIPSARPAAEADRVLQLWRQQGYKIALWRDSTDSAPMHDILIVGEYPGWAGAINALTKEVLRRDPECMWCVGGGDDTEPDMNHTADEIAEQCRRYFVNTCAECRHDSEEHSYACAACGRIALQLCPNASFAYHAFRMGEPTFGVMQPTGDRFAQGSIDRIAGSPWLGREWCERANQGQGPLYPEFTHMFADECLQRVAEKLGVFWQRRDLIHLHHHFMRASADVNAPAVRTAIPKHLVKWNTPQHWDEMKAIYERLKAQDFAPCMPLAVEVVA